MQFYVSVVFLPLLSVFFGYLFNVVWDYGNLGLVFAWVLAILPNMVLLVFMFFYFENKFLDGLRDTEDFDVEFKSLENY